MNVAHRSHGAVLLQTGEVLVAGGRISPTENITTAELFTDNASPTADAGGPYVVDEGASVLVVASGDDPEDDPLLFAWDLDDDGSFETPGQSVTFSAAGLDGPSTHVVTVQVTDTGGRATTDETTIEVHNVAPTVGPITAPVAPVQVGTTLNASADFTDPGVLDTHTATWTWGDSSTSPGVVSEADGSGTVTGSHTYTAPGVYTVTLTVADDDGDAGQSVFQFVVVYDPAAGFVTGGGWIWSDVGWCQLNTVCADADGKANFGFVSKYKKGATIPTGNTEFNFSAGNLNFHSDTYEWLVVNQQGTNAQFKGSGTINNALAPNGAFFKFMVWAGDGAPDTFRIKIWFENGSETVVYDNGFAQAIGGGSIVIHKQ